MTIFEWREMDGMEENNLFSANKLQKYIIHPALVPPVQSTEGNEKLSLTQLCF